MLSSSVHHLRILNVHWCIIYREREITSSGKGSNGDGGSSSRLQSLLEKLFLCSIYCRTILYKKRRKRGEWVQRENTKVGRQKKDVLPCCHPIHFRIFLQNAATLGFWGIFSFSSTQNVYFLRILTAKQRDPHVCQIHKNTFYLWHCTSLFCAKIISDLL